MFVCEVGLDLPDRLGCLMHAVRSRLVSVLAMTVMG